MPPEWRDSVSIRNVKERFRNCCRVVPRPRQLAAFPQTPLGGRAAPRIPPAKTPATGAPSNRPARCNPSAALTNIDISLDILQKIHKQPANAFNDERLEWESLLK